VDDYTTEFYRLVVHIDLAKSDDELVSSYIEGMRIVSRFFEFI
jgi:hypothetical protein